MTARKGETLTTNPPNVPKEGPGVKVRFGNLIKKASQKKNPREKKGKRFRERRPRHVRKGDFCCSKMNCMAQEKGALGGIW